MKGFDVVNNLFLIEMSDLWQAYFRIKPIFVLPMLQYSANSQNQINGQE
jgi:hypothetical protein